MKLSPAFKKWLRSTLLERRKSLPKKKRDSLSRRINKHFLRTKEYRTAKTIAVYLGFGSEVLTDSLIRQAWKNKKNILIPDTSKGLHKPFFCVYKKGDFLKKSKYGPCELVQSKEPVSFNKIDIVLVPGLGFDLRGHRVGYGGGTYDRILQKTKKAHHIGLFFSNQMLHRLPFESHDRTLDRVLTERGFVSLLAKLR